MFVSQNNQRPSTIDHQQRSDSGKTNRKRRPAIGPKGMARIWRLKKASTLKAESQQRVPNAIDNCQLTICNLQFWSNRSLTPIAGSNTGIQTSKAGEAKREQRESDLPLTTHNSLRPVGIQTCGSVGPGRNNAEQGTKVQTLTGKSLCLCVSVVNPGTRGNTMPSNDKWAAKE